MPIWDGDTWACERCDAVNAILRSRCRFCGEPKREPHPDPEIEAGIQADIHEAAAVNRRLGIGPEPR